MPGERNADYPVAQLAGEPPQAGAFRAQHPGDRAGQVGGEQAFRRIGVGAYQPYAPLLQRTQRARQVRHRDHRHRVRGAGRDLGHRGIDADRPILGDDDRVDAEGIGAAQAGAQVVRVGDAVEDEEEGGLVEGVEDVFDRDNGFRRRRHRGDALMAVMADQFVELGAVDWIDLDAGGFRLIEQGLGAGVVAVMAKIKLENR